MLRQYCVHSPRCVRVWSFSHLADPTWALHGAIVNWMKSGAYSRRTYVHWAAVHILRPYCGNIGNSGTHHTSYFYLALFSLTLYTDPIRTSTTASKCELRRGYEGSRKAHYCLHYDTFASYMTKINAVFIIHLIFNSDFPAQLGTLAIHVYGDGFGSLFAQSIDALHSAFCGRKSVKSVLCRWLAFRFIRTNSAFRLRPDFKPLPAIHDHPRCRSMPTSCRSQRPTKRCASVRSTDCQLHHGSTLRRIS